MSKSKAWLLGLVLLVVSASGGFASTFCPANPQKCSPHALIRTPSGAIAIQNVCDLQAIPQDSTDSYEFTQNIDATCTMGWNGGAGFIPIAGTFVGSLEGNGHWINGLHIASSPSTVVGLFEQMGGNVDSVALTNVDVRLGTAFSVGALSGQIVGNGVVSSAYITGCVSKSPGCVGTSYYLVRTGGLAGGNFGTISGSFVNMVVRGGTSGGLVGTNDLGIQNSSSAGIVEGNNVAGGLAGESGFGGLNDSYSGATVIVDTTPGDSYAGGLIGKIDGYFPYIANSYAAGIVSGGSYEGGLVALTDQSTCGGTISSIYSVGSVVGTGLDIGGLDGSGCASAFSNAYWDTTTSGQLVSAAGNPEKTKQLQANLLPGFSSSTWALVPNVTYPFDITYSCPWGSPQATNCALPPIVVKGFPLRDPNCVDPDGDDFFCLIVPPTQSFFESPLAQFIASQKDFGKHSGVYATLPVGQLQLFQYSSYKNAETPVEDDSGKKYSAAKLACFGTVYTMLARLIGAVYPDAKVIADNGTPNICHQKELASQAHIDCLLEDSADLKIKGLGIWPSSLQKYVAIGGYVSLDDPTAESLIESGHQLIIQGSAGGLIHVMLATSEIKDSSGNVIRLVANDPELGMQVFIDVNLHDGAAYHRAVLHPTGMGNASEYKNIAGFNFSANGYATVTWQRVQ